MILHRNCEDTEQLCKLNTGGTEARKGSEKLLKTGCRFGTLERRFVTGLLTRPVVRLYLYQVFYTYERNTFFT